MGSLALWAWAGLWWLWCGGVAVGVGLRIFNNKSINRNRSLPASGAYFNWCQVPSLYLLDTLSGHRSEAQGVMMQ